MLWFELRAPKRYIEVLPPVPCDCDLPWKQGLCRCNQIKMSLYSMRVALNPMSLASLQEDHMMTEAESTAMCLEAKEWQRLPPTTRIEERWIEQILPQSL